MTTTYLTSEESKALLEEKQNLEFLNKSFMDKMYVLTLETLRKEANKFHARKERIGMINEFLSTYPQEINL